MSWYSDLVSVDVNEAAREAGELASRATYAGVSP